MNPVSGQQKLNLLNVEQKSVELNFDGGQISSDGGLLLLREVENQISLIDAIAGTINDKRHSSYITHTIKDMLMQRIWQIAAGYEDANDCDELRNDPVLKVCAHRLPETGADLASQPTMSRFENSISRSQIYRIAKIFVDNFLASYEKPPKIIVLDFDDTSDEVHGEQQLALFNGYYSMKCFMPLHVYEGLSGKLITTILKPGKRSDGKTILAILKRLCTHIRREFPDTTIVFRGDSHFTYSQTMEWIEQQDNMFHVTGLTGNNLLRGMVKAHIERARKLYKEKQDKVILFHSFNYKAKKWNQHRRVVAKVEILADGTLNLRYIVTNMKAAKAAVLYQRIYCARGEAELYIKEHKLYLKSDRTSCHQFSANQFRLFLHSAAYVLLHALKNNILRYTQWANATISTIRLKFLKIGARVRQLKTKIKIELPTSFPYKKALSNGFQILEILRQST